MKHKTLSYRPDIDGLRAIAVLAVLLYHTDFAVISGGFVGVDIFFVISGYLITSIIVKEMLAGEFSLVNFYERRIRRILPAFIIVAVFTLIMAYELFLPQEFNAFAKSLIAASLSLSNVLFWSEAGYFDTSSELKPLLHTWSLGVEEQFYIIFPLCLILIGKYCRRQWIAWLLPVALISLGLSLWGVEERPEDAFFLIHMRAWELLLGALLALGGLPRVHKDLIREAYALLGIILILSSILILNDDSPFPGANAIFPCVGAAFVIHAGSNGATTFVGRALSFRPVVFVGLISYSLYLWHWPLIVFFKYYFIEPLTTLQIVVILFLSFALACLSWRFVERPFRKRRELIKRRYVFAVGAFSSATLVAGGMIVVLDHGMSDRVPKAVKVIAAGAKDISFPMRKCMLENRKWEKGAGLCVIGAKHTEPSFVVLGDSHANALIPGIVKAATKYGRSGLHAGLQSCPPLDGVKHRGGERGRQCRKFREAVLSMIEHSQSLKKVILIARWPLHAEGSRYGPQDVGADFRLVDLKGHVRGNHAVFAAGVERTVARLRKAGKEIYLVFSLPEVGWNVPGILARLKWTGRHMEIRPTRKIYMERNNFVYKVFMRMKQKYRAHILFPDSILCDSEWCSVEVKGQPLYSDDDHLSRTGAEYISPIFDEVFSID